MGGFAPVFEGMGWHDLDLGYRLRKYGLEKVYIPIAISYHIQPPLRTPEQLAARHKRRGRENRRLFPGKAPRVENPPQHPGYKDPPLFKLGSPGPAASLPKKTS